MTEKEYIVATDLRTLRCALSVLGHLQSYSAYSVIETERRRLIELLKKAIKKMENKMTTLEEA